MDLDFADIREYSPDEYFGVIVLRLERHDVPNLIEVLKRLIPRLNDEDLVGKLWIVNERTIRIRG